MVKKPAETIGAGADEEKSENAPTDEEGDTNATGGMLSTCTF